MIAAWLVISPGIHAVSAAIALRAPHLMQHAFAPDGGPLTDPSIEPGERVGVMSLYVGAFGAVRNGLVHTEVEWADPDGSR